MLRSNLHDLHSGSPNCLRPCAFLNHSMPFCLVLCCPRCSPIPLLPNERQVLLLLRNGRPCLQTGPSCVSLSSLSVSLSPSPSHCSSPNLTLPLRPLSLLPLPRAPVLLPSRFPMPEICLSLSSWRSWWSLVACGRLVQFQEIGNK